MPEWLEMLIRSSKTGQTKICLVAVDVFIKLLKKPDVSPKGQLRGNCTSIMQI
jgi:hypothetical protein